MNPLVSISCITYNHAPCIRQCLDGFLMQECNFKYEILIHDDASTDGTQEIIKEYVDKYPEIIKPIYQTQNQYSQGVRGMNVKFNFPRAKGKYIALCEGDDYWTDPLKLQKQVDFLEKNEEYGLVHTNYSILKMKTGEITLHHPSDYNRNSEFDYYLRSGDMRTLTVLFRNNYKEEINKLFTQNFMIDSPIGDRPLFLLLGSLAKIKFISDDTGIYRITSSESASHFSDIFKYYSYLKKVNNLNLSLYQYLKIDFQLNKELEKFCDIISCLEKNTLKAVFMMIFSGLNLKFFQEFYGILKIKYAN